MEKHDQSTYDGYIKALTDISRAITSDLFLEDLLKLIVMVTAKVTGVEICSLWLIDESEKPPQIRLKATQSIDPEVVKTKVIQEELETRKMVERAKEILMHRRQMKGEEAFRWLQKRSMDSRKPLRHIAEAIILSEDIAHER